LEATPKPCGDLEALREDDFGVGDLEALREDDFGVLTGLGLFMRGAVVSHRAFRSAFSSLSTMSVAIDASVLFLLNAFDLIDPSVLFLRELLGVEALLTVKAAESPLFRCVRRSLLLEHTDLLDGDLNSLLDILLSIFRGDVEVKMVFSLFRDVVVVGDCPHSINGCPFSIFEDLVDDDSVSECTSGCGLEEGFSSLFALLPLDLLEFSIDRGIVDLPERYCDDIMIKVRMRFCCCWKSNTNPKNVECKGQG
jgi:hypothetical protein